MSFFPLSQRLKMLGERLLTVDNQISLCNNVLEDLQELQSVVLVGPLHLQKLIKTLLVLLRCSFPLLEEESPGCTATISEVMQPEARNLCLTCVFLNKFQLK